MKKIAGSMQQLYKCGKCFWFQHTCSKSTAINCVEIRL